MKIYLIPIAICLTIFSACGGGQAARTPGSTGQSSGPNNDSEISSLKRAVHSIDSTLTSEAGKIKNLNTAVTDIGNKIEEFDLRLLRMESMMAVGNMMNSVNPRVPLNAVDYLNEYQKAMEFFNYANYSEALDIFEKLLGSNPHSELADNSQYWIGECYYGNKEYERAILEFEKVFTFPNNNKMEAAQLKLGICYLRLNDKKRAQEEFSRLVNLYPGSEYLPIASKLLNRL
ncbi:MAG: tetratricopeptide repeat protein [Candidatus Marinimicrobia bacterium]|nr:tetratricopeptide repeat protein [Candidatus Neomarinimicrobiota bacterium]